MTSRHKLVRVDAPAYWTRWAVEVDSVIIGYVEKRGGFAPWTVRDADWNRLHTATKRAEAIAWLTTPREASMTNTTTLTDEQVNAAIRKWGDTADARVIADIIIETNLRDDVVPDYLEWLDDVPLTMARPNLRQLLKDQAEGRGRPMSSSAYFLATFVASIRHGETPVDLTKLWNLGPHNREAVVRALATGLNVTL